MKTRESHTPAVQAKKSAPFFGKGGGNFFGKGRGRGPAIQRKAETDNKGNYTGNYIFNPGVDGLSRSFFSEVKKDVAGGTLTDKAIGDLRTNAIARNGTMMQAELLLMAAMRNPVNVALMQAYKSGSLIIPMAQIKKTDEDYLMNFGRDAMPADIMSLEWRSLAAALGLTGEKVSDLQDQAGIKAYNYILQYAGDQFNDQASQLLAEAQAQPEVPDAEVLQAMLNGASDSTPGDKVMAGMVYLIAKRANHPMAAQIMSGALKVDALIPSVYKRLGIGGEASYQYSTDGDLMKADTIYVPTSLNLFDLADRALVIHELTHAADDFAVTGTKAMDSLQLETHAYKEQGRYMMDQILALPAAEQTVYLTTAAGYTKRSPLYYWSMVAAAKDNAARYGQVLVDINTHAPMSMGSSAVKADLGLSAATLTSNVRSALLAYRDAQGKQLYQAGTTTVNGPTGQYFHP